MRLSGREGERRCHAPQGVTVSDSRPLISWADVGVVPFAPSPPALAPSANSRPESHCEALPSLKAGLFLMPGKYLSKAAFMVLFAGMFAK